MSVVNDPGPEIHPSVVFLFDLLRWVREGKITAAEFQRDYVWNRGDILELFDSVKASYPIGTLLFWTDPSGKNVPKSSWRLGPFKLAGVAAERPMLVLDGQQRLTTLAGVLLRAGDAGASLRDERDPARWDVYFDAVADRFTHLREPPKPWQVPASALAETSTMFGAVGELFKLDGRQVPTGLTVRQLADRIQGVARALQSYRLPIVEFRTTDLNLAVESFTRLNRRGVSVGPDEMFTALTHQDGKKDGFDIAHSIDVAQAQLSSVGFGEVDRLIILRTFLVVADLDPYRTDWKRLGEETRQVARTVLPTAMEKATKGLRDAVDFLRAEGMYNTRLLPYGVQLLGIAVWFAENPNPTESSRRLLRRWLWLTSFSAWFGQGNPSRYARLFKEMVQTARQAEKGAATASLEFDQLPWATAVLPFPRVFDFRSARARAWLCVMLRRGSMDLAGNEVTAGELARRIKDRGPSMLRRIVSAKFALQSSPANRMFDVFEDATQAQARTLLRVQAPPPEFWTRHHLDSVVCGDDAGLEELERCIQARLERMVAIETQFLTDLDLTPYAVDAAPVDTPIDADRGPDDLDFDTVQLELSPNDSNEPE